MKKLNLILSLIMLACLVIFGKAQGASGELITRSHALEIAHIYHGVEWKLESANIHVDIYSPPNIVCPYTDANIGFVENVPYSWNGYDEIYAFLKKIMDGAGAGNVGDDASSAIAGIDCSGYVSRALKTSPRYQTSTFNDVSYEVGWNNLAPGDIANRPNGHIILIEEYLPATDTVVRYESTTADPPGGVARRTSLKTKLNQYQDYTARRYNYISSSPSIISVLRNDQNSVEIKWLGDLGLSNRDPAYRFEIYKSTDLVNWELAGFKSGLTLDDQRIILYGLSPEKIYYFKVIAQKPTGPSEPSSIFSIRLDNSNMKPKVLIVDGYDRWFGHASNPDSLNNDFTLRYANPLNSLGISFETVDNLIVTRSKSQKIGEAFNLNEYQAIIYMLGDESTADYSLNILEQLALVKYLENGGKLFISGSNIGYDLIGSNGPQLTGVLRTPEGRDFSDKVFYQEYLKSSGNSPRGTYRDIRVNAGGIFESLGDFSFDQTLYSVSSYDRISPLGAMVNLEYVASAVAKGAAGINYTGRFGSGIVDGKLIYLAFPFELIDSETIRNQMMKGIMEYFDAEINIIYGELSGEGDITAYDAALAARIAVGLDAYPTGDNLTKADVSGGGGVTAYDAALIAQRAVGLISKFPVE
jgi:hypothetical protein